MGSGASAPVQRVSSAEATRRNTEIDQQLLVDKQEEKITFKLLLLGGSESGKSTIAKQMRIIHLNGFGETDLINYRFLVHSNLVELFTQLISAATRLKAHMDDETKRLITAFNAFRKSALFGSHEINDQAKYVIDKLWASSAIQGVYERREEITSLPDNTDYLIERFDQICRSDYIPNQQDILYSRIATTGVHEIRFPFNNRFFRYDLSFSLSDT
uniref:Uncharacterized protein n=1 Tax=Plectus sambesii TaxID=2011161 RepID=A0A914UPH9_9BILA